MGANKKSDKKSQSSRDLPARIGPKEEITDKLLIGTENFLDGPDKPENPIYWPGINTSHITIRNQPGSITDVAVAFKLKGNPSQEADVIGVTLISPSGVRVPIAGTSLDPEWLSYRNPINPSVFNKDGLYTPKTFNLQQGQTQSYIFSNSKALLSEFNIDLSIKRNISQTKTQQSLSSLNPLKGTPTNGRWGLEVKNSSDAAIKLVDWQLFLKSKDEVQKRVASSTGITPKSLHPKTTLNQAVTALEADSARVKYGVNGAGVKIGLISNSFNSLNGEEWDYKTGVLDQSKINVLLNQDTAETIIGPLPAGAEDEGRAMAQNVYSIAPGAEILFHSWNDGFFGDLQDAAYDAESTIERDQIIRNAFQVNEIQGQKFREILIELAEADARVIVDDLGDAEPFFEDGLMAKAIKEVKDTYGVAYFTASGNSLNQSYMNTFQPRNREAIDKATFDLLPLELQQELNAGHELHLFEGSNGSSSYLQTIIAGKDVTLQWNSKWGQNTKKLKILVFDENNNFVREGLRDPDNEYPWAYAKNPAGVKSQYSIAVVHDGKTAETRPDVFKWIDLGNTNVTVSANSDLGFYQATVTGHANGTGSANVQSNQYWGTPAYQAKEPTLGRFGSWGVTPIYFDAEGNFLAEPELRKNPSFVAPQKGNTTFFSKGYTKASDAERDFLQNFEGTSAAAPNAAAVAALMRQLDPTLTPDEIYNILKKTATQIQEYPTSVTSADGFNSATGFGLINAKAALKEIAKRKPSVEVFLDGNGNGRFDKTNAWEDFTAAGSKRKLVNNKANDKRSMMKDELTGLSTNLGYDNVIDGSQSLISKKALSDNSLILSSINSTDDYDVITQRGDITLDGDLLLVFDGASSNTPGTYSILQAKSIQGSFDTLRVEGLDSNLYIGVGIRDGKTFDVTVADTFFDGSMQAGALF